MRTILFSEALEHLAASLLCSLNFSAGGWVTLGLEDQTNGVVHSLQELKASLVSILSAMLACNDHPAVPNSPSHTQLGRQSDAPSSPMAGGGKLASQGRARCEAGIEGIPSCGAGAWGDTEQPVVHASAMAQLQLGGKLLERFRSVLRWVNTCPPNRVSP